MTPMTFQEFSTQIGRLHSRYPNIYQRRYQIELAFMMANIPYDWFKFRVDYILRSGNGRYDWKNAVESFHRTLVRQKISACITTSVERAESDGVPLPEFLESVGATSIVEAFEKTVEAKRE